MKLFHKSKDGGPDSNVTGYWLIEWKPVFSIVLLKFSKGTREAYHSHAFHAISWIIKGELSESRITGSYDFSEKITAIRPSLLPLFTSRSNCHRITGVADSTLAISFRGPWVDTWIEFFKEKSTLTILTHGRKVLAEHKTI